MKFCTGLAQTLKISLLLLAIITEKEVLNSSFVRASVSARQIQISDAGVLSQTSLICVSIHVAHTFSHRFPRCRSYEQKEEQTTDESPT